MLLLNVVQKIKDRYPGLRFNEAVEQSLMWSLTFPHIFAIPKAKNRRIGIRTKGFYPDESDYC